MPILSILIPTRERVHYLRSAIQSCLAIRDADIEIVVSDNASLDGTRAAVADFKDTRMRYVNTGQRVSMRENFELAASFATGDYFVMIGDDDAVVPTAMSKLVGLLRREQPDLVHWSPPLYGWPSGGEPSTAHLLLTQAMVFGGYERLATDKLVAQLCEGSLKSQRIMPSIYHGCISRRLMDQIKARGGHFFGSSIPDCYVSFIGCMLAPHYIRLEHPVTVAGASPKSNASYNDASLAQFAAEVKMDPVIEPLDISSMTTATLYLSTLLAVARIAPVSRAINWPRWIERSVAELRQKYPEPAVQQAHIDRLRTGLAQFAIPFPAVAAEASATTAKKKRIKRGHKFSLSRIRLRFGQDSTVMDAVTFIEDISSSRKVTPSNAWSKATRHAAWAMALIQSTRRTNSTH